MKTKTCRCHSEKNNDKNIKNNRKIKQLEGCKIKECKKLIENPHTRKDIKYILQGHIDKHVVFNFHIPNEEHETIKPQ